MASFKFKLLKTYQFVNSVPVSVYFRDSAHPPGDLASYTGGYSNYSHGDGIHDTTLSTEDASNH